MEKIFKYDIKREKITFQMTSILISYQMLKETFIKEFSSKDFLYENCEKIHV